MTLLAAYRHNDIPVLIGDVTLTKGDIRSLRKKVYIICPNFAVGWAGHMIVAKSVISSLRDAFHNKTTTRILVEQFFTNHDSLDFGALHTNFIGWIIEGDQQHCFLWNCLYPKEVFYGQQYFDGTGEGYFVNLRSEKWQKGGSGPPADDAAVLGVINEVARARFEESLFTATWDISFGISYDVILFLLGQFRYVGSIVYIGWDYHLNSSQCTGELETAPVMIKHNCFGEFSIVQEALQGARYDGKTLNYLSRPVFDDMPTANLSNFQLAIAADYYSNYFLFRESGKVVFKTLLTVQQITSHGPLKVVRRNDGALFFGFDTDMLDGIYRSYRNDDLGN